MMPIPFNNPSTYTDRPHSGIDFGQGTGTIIRASGHGLITFSGWFNNNAGWSVIVTYFGGPIVLYCHMPENGARASIGSEVVEGSFLGTVGSSGRSTGPHLHMEIMHGEGAHTDRGVWNYFDRNKVVGIPAPTNSTESDSDMLVWIKGRKGARSGGIWLFKDGKASWLGAPPKPAEMIAIEDEVTIKRLFSHYKVV